MTFSKQTLERLNSVLSNTKKTRDNYTNEISEQDVYNKNQLTLIKYYYKII